MLPILINNSPFTVGSRAYARGVSVPDVFGPNVFIRIVDLGSGVTAYQRPDPGTCIGPGIGPSSALRTERTPVSVGVSRRRHFDPRNRTVVSA